jgi:hypothetical protein
MSELERIVNDFVGSCIPDRHKKELVSALKSEFMKAVDESFQESFMPECFNCIKCDICKKPFNQAKSEITQKIKEM